MAEYTPDAPIIVGNEWVPIKEDPYILDATQEQGTSFHLDTSSTVVTGRIYVSDPPLNYFDASLFHLAVSYNMNVYPRGQETATGLIKSVIIPCTLAQTSGDVVVSGPNATSALALVGDGRFLKSTQTAGSQSGVIAMNFGVSAFPELSGKRILGVEWVYALNVSDGYAGQNEVVLEHLQFAPSASVSIVQNQDILSQTGSNLASVPSVATPPYNALGSLPAGLPGDVTVYPWNYTKLLLLESTQAFSFAFGLREGLTDFIQLDYSAIKVIYCEEKRVLYGGFAGEITQESNTVELRGPAQAPGGAVLPPGDYTVTVEGQGLQTELYALRELYAMPLQPGIRIDRSLRDGDQFTSVQTPQLVQLSLHTASSSLSPVHPYGRQVEKDVHSTSFPHQDIVHEGPAGGADYPWARFYARRLSGTAQALTLRSVAAPAIAASVSVAEFDVLPEITDGWKEVTLRFTGTLPSFTNSGANSTWEWVTGDPLGQQWQILGASALVKDGGQFTLPQITGAHSLDAATYGGATADLSNVTWEDATLMFAQEMPAVSGFSLELASQEITGIGMECGLFPPECVPTGISYHALAWDQLGPASIPASGFGYYELQRSDADDPGDWFTIMTGGSPLVTGFSDFEARAGVESSYRIRFVHHLGFEGPWSSVLSSTLPAPGVLGSSGGNGVLIFTSNERQDGSSNLAYVQIWENDPSETFEFIEAGQVQFQTFYQRDFQVAFHGTERGGERFQRTILVQAAAVPTGRIRDGFRSLRDMAWEDTSYVCVRNELGDRWLSNVLVPDGDVRRNRRLYMAGITVTEVTGTPSAVGLPDAVVSGGSAGDIFGAAVWDGLPGWDYGAWSA